MSKPGHRKFELFAHVTWHTERRARYVRQTDVATVTRTVLQAAARHSVHVLAQVVLADHVHVLVSFPARPGADALHPRREVGVGSSGE